MVQTFGIRHHGPGSAKRLLGALERYQPDCLLVEAPQEAEAVFKYLLEDGLKLPVALLLYNPKQLDQASFFPFATFSPEYQAIKWCLTRQIDVRAMDLPAALSFGLERERAEAEQIGLDFEALPSEELLELRRDPLGALSKLAGYQDSERWWEITFESTLDDGEVFPLITRMMRELRSETAPVEDPETLRREAFMRKTLRKALKDGFRRVAVVCGAYHAPALADYEDYKVSADNAILRGLKRVKPQATWIPWSYERLTRQTGYGAGVRSPAWYRMLFQKRGETLVRWMTKAARLLREEHQTATAAHAIEAVRLAEGLAALRGLGIPGLPEMEEAVVTTLCYGQREPFEIIHQKLIVGDRTGRIPPSVPQIPLQRNLEAEVRSARLKKEYESSERLTKKLDLRKDANLRASKLLHRLRLLGIPWGTRLETNANALGSFSENWQLKWRPDYAIRLIEAGMYGTTIPEAANRKILEEARTSTDLARLAERIGQCLDADLPDAVRTLLDRLRNVTALTEDVYLLMVALPPLGTVLRYGNLRGTDVSAVGEVVEEVVPRVCVGLPQIGIGVDEEVAETLFAGMVGTTRTLSLLRDDGLNAQWLRALTVTLGTPGVHPLLHGTVLRLLFNREVLAPERVADELQLALSRGGVDTLAAANWLRGFLHGSGLLLVHHAPFWRLVDGWINARSDEEFQTLLPLLRRTFSEMPAGERRKILELARRRPHGNAVQQDATPLDPDRADAVLATVRTLLG